MVVGSNSVVVVVGEAEGVGTGAGVSTGMEGSAVTASREERTCW